MEGDGARPAPRVVPLLLCDGARQRRRHRPTSAGVRVWTCAPLHAESDGLHTQHAPRPEAAFGYATAASPCFSTRDSSRSRIALMSSGVSGRIGVRQASSKRRIVCLSIAPKERPAGVGRVSRERGAGRGRSVGRAVTPSSWLRVTGTRHDSSWRRNRGPQRRPSAHARPSGI